jgi:hypothetical protein
MSCIESVAFQLGLDSRWSERHRYDGVADKDSGGFIGFLAAGIVINLAEDLLLTMTVQHPTIKHLNGDHEEQRIFRLGLVYDLSWH